MVDISSKEREDKSSAETLRAVMIAGTGSGVGKTSVSLGLMSALKKKGLRVQPFKVGPDYIDPGFHEYVTDTGSYNLDSWLIPSGQLRHLWQQKNAEAEISVVEGVMGLFDGASPRTDRGSSAEIAKMLDIPVLLIIDTGGMARSAAAMAKGYSEFSSELNLAGVIANRVGSQSHFELIAEALESETDLECVGYLPKNIDVELPERHLGLIPAGELKELERAATVLGDMVAENLSLDSILNLAEEADNFTKPEEEKNSGPAASLTAKNSGNLQLPGQNLKIGVARDEAFSFHYRANFDLLRELGCELVEFSPLQDEKLPAGLDGLYMAGGFPEVFAEELSCNRKFRENLKQRLEQGLPCFAECGGFMYLMEEICSRGGDCFTMVEYFSGRTVMTDSLQNFGYVNIDLSDGLKLRGHEFHYSRLEESGSLPFQGRVKRQRSGEARPGMAVKENVLAGYPHLHFFGNQKFVARWLNLCAGEINSWL
ncbi:cobyrinate a,c-diamide synthase [Halarsenatibacter silvermanii]|uniref:Cobyrinate a,c-diamide synthase n=1 Tax=Halarsenatibacter silvermanii TaxID=321763 RepID=A0A1G9R1Y1_9FIRM|nr:cobyrinate a,c-diamide synthase [Halarsenatibacter silvermanii]SDM16857.1 cobyrinic acid a,c-diamide synthase [Halarsenatibacter silvermanii]